MRRIIGGVAAAILAVTGLGAATPASAATVTASNQGTYSIGTCTTAVANDSTPAAGDCPSAGYAIIANQASKSVASVFAGSGARIKVGQLGTWHDGPYWAPAGAEVYTQRISTSAAATLGWGQPVSGDQFTGTTLNPDKWSPYSGAGQSGRGTRDPGRIVVAGGNVTLTGTSDGTTGAMSAKFDRTDSSKVVLGATDSGRWETRMMVTGATADVDRQTGWDPVLIGWPDDQRIAANNCQEMDYAEGSTDANVVHTWIHYGCNGEQAGTTVAVDQNTWHTYSLDWSQGKLTTYVDGVPLYTTTNAAIIPNAASHETIQLDDFFKAADPTTGDPGRPLGTTKMIVDYTDYYPGL